MLTTGEATSCLLKLSSFAKLQQSPFVYPFTLNHAVQNILGGIYEFNHTASMAQSDARSTVDQKIAGSIPAGSGNILLWRLIMKYFSFCKRMCRNTG